MCVFVFMCGVVLKPVVLQSVDQAPKGQKGLAGQLSQRWAVSWRVQGYAQKTFPPFSRSLYPKDLRISLVSDTYFIILISLSSTIIYLCQSQPLDVFYFHVRVPRVQHGLLAVPPLFCRTIQQIQCKTIHAHFANSTHFIKFYFGNKVDTLTRTTLSCWG